MKQHGSDDPPVTGTLWFLAVKSAARSEKRTSVKRYNIACMQPPLPQTAKVPADNVDKTRPTRPPAIVLTRSHSLLSPTVSV